MTGCPPPPSGSHTRTEPLTIVESPSDFNVGRLYVDLHRALGHRLLLKCEGFNFAGSVKLKAAVGMVEQLEREGRLRPGQAFVESTSGNMGVALSVVAADRGYRFVCVTDPRCTAANRYLIAALGAELHVVDTPREDTGFLGARLATVRRMCDGDPGLVWLNQYANPANWFAHYTATATEVADAFDDLDVLFVGAGTTGTLMGCARYFRRYRPEVTIVAVDVVGSVTFGGPAGDRLLPGLGTSVRPAVVDESLLDDVVLVDETETVAMCRRLAACGYAFGGSTGTVVRGAVTWLRRHRAQRSTTCVAISPDLGWAYAETVYNPDWVDRSLGRSGPGAGSPIVPGTPSPAAEVEDSPT